MPFAYLVPTGRTPEPLFTDADLHAQRTFFAARPDLTPTPLRALPGLAARLGLRAVLAKDETARFTLNAFKTAGAAFAVAALQAQGRVRPGDTLVCASEGNHGRAVARAARDAGCHARVYLGVRVAPDRAEAIRSEGAAVVSVDGTYDEAVRRMARDAEAHGWTIVSDTAWDGYEEIPRLIMLGYTRLMDEAEAAWAPGGRPDVMFVQTGVGGLLAAVASWNSARYGPERPRIVAVEPTAAACMLTSVRNDRPTALSGTLDTTMGGLRCGEISTVSFAAARSLVDAYVAIEDTWAFEAMRRLGRPVDADPPVAAGPSGAAALGALLALRQSPDLAAIGEQLELGERTTALVIVTEGVTEPGLYRQVVDGSTRRSGAP